MKGIITKTILPFLALAAFPMAALAEDEPESPWSANLEVSFLSDYAFRGQNYYNGFSIQPSATISYDFGEYGSVSNLVWMHLSADPQERPNRFTELDEVITYTLPLDTVTFSTGVFWYTYPGYSDQIDSSREYYFAAFFDAPLNPVISFYHDDKKYKSQYYELAISETYDAEAFDSELSATPFAAFGFVDNAEALYEDNGFVQATVGLSLNIPVGEFTLKPLINYVYKSDANVDEGFWGGLSLSYAM